MPKKKILVADDDHGIIDAMQILLEDEGYEVITAIDADAIQDKIEQHPDLIFLDIWMSGINGTTICKKIKEDDKTKQLPVIMFSANRDTEDISRQCGADGFLSKPFDIKELLELVHNYIGEPTG